MGGLDRQQYGKGVRRLHLVALLVLGISCSEAEDCDVFSIPPTIAVLQLQGAATSVVARSTDQEVPCTAQLPWTGRYVCNSDFEGAYSFTVELNSGVTCTSDSYEVIFLGCPSNSELELSLTSSTCAWSVVNCGTGCGDL